MRNEAKKKATKSKAPKGKPAKGHATKAKVTKVSAAKGHAAKTKAAKPGARKPEVAKVSPAKAPVAKLGVVKAVAPKVEAVKVEVTKLPVAKPVKVVVPFSEGDYVVYPTHGVGRVRAIEKQKIAGQELELFVITFDRDRMTLRVPVPKATQSGLRKLSSHSVMETALTTLRGRARVKRTMWSRRAQEYEAKINSGDPVSIAEVVRDLHRHANQPDQSYSERQIYEAALERLASELAAVDGIERDKATQKLETLLDAA